MNNIPQNATEIVLKTGGYAKKAYKKRKTDKKFNSLVCFCSVSAALNANKIPAKTMAGREKCIILTTNSQLRVYGASNKRRETERYENKFLGIFHNTQRSTAPSEKEAKLNIL